jgi:hypothetical protein
MGFDYGPMKTGPSLRANPESLDVARDPEPVEGHVRSTVSWFDRSTQRLSTGKLTTPSRVEGKSASKPGASWQTVMNESEAFMNNPG